MTWLRLHEIKNREVKKHLDSGKHPRSRLCTFGCYCVSLDFVIIKRYFWPRKKITCHNEFGFRFSIFDNLCFEFRKNERQIHREIKY